MLSTGSLNSVSISSNSTTNSQNAVYTFTISASSPLVDGDQIYIEIPDSITPPTSPTCIGIIKLSSTLAWQALNTFIYVTLSFGSGTTLDAGTSFSFSISTFINPPSTKESDAFNFEAQDSDGFLINSYTSALPVTFSTTTPTTITTASVSNDNKNAYKSATFSLNFTTVNEIPVDGVIVITYPAEVEPIDPSVTTLTCSVNIATSPTCTHDEINRKITISNVVAGSTLAKATAIQIELNEMRNPEFSSTTSSFIIITYEVVSSVQYAIDRVNSGLTLTVNCDFPCLTCSSSDKSQ